MTQVCGINSTRNPIQVREKVGYLPEDVGFYDDMTGIENLLYTARLNRIPEADARNKAEELLERVGLPVDTQKKAGKYSGYAPTSRTGGCADQATGSDYP